MKSAILAYQEKVFNALESVKLNNVSVPVFNRAPGQQGKPYVHIPDHLTVESENDTLDKFIHDYILRVQIVTEGDDNYTEKDSLLITNEVIDAMIPNKKSVLDLSPDFKMLTHEVSNIIPSEYKSESGREIRQTIEFKATIKNV